MMNKNLIKRIKRLETKKEGLHVVMALVGTEEAALKKYKKEHPDAEGIFIIVLDFKASQSANDTDNDSLDSI